MQKKKEEEAAENKPEETTKVEERTLAEIATKQEIVAKVDTVPPRTDTTKGEDTGKKPKKTDAVKTIVPEAPVPTPAETLDDEGWIIVKPKGKKR